MQYLQLFGPLRWLFGITLIVQLLVGCATSNSSQQVATDSSVAPAGFPADYYQQAAASGRKVWRITPERSLVTIEVRRAGRLARLGHDHVVASRDARGYVALDEGRTDLYIPLAQLTVDEPALRAEAGLETQPTPEAIEGTRNNMLVKVLDVEHFPFVLINAVRINSSSVLKLSITLHGTTRMFEVPAQLEILPNELKVSGRVSFNQSDFGIVPFSILGGAMQVRDRVDLQFRIVAQGN